MDINEAGSNLLFILENVALLEDHFLVQQMNCSWCVYKHIIKISGYAREGLTLNNATQFSSTFSQILEWIGTVYSAFVAGTDYFTLGQNMRENRQKIIKQFFPNPNQQLLEV